ncbi:poly [ADP-ribose] polymerase tankyrase-like isoform X1 [Cloeon dipterum]|uniref:poly [ADP-ribose] polymerase tankyrase-like isoform X1 n=2 Tax=Cloeon dipterum TaxID=197152 RepID=UPI003220603E
MFFVIFRIKMKRRSSRKGNLSSGSNSSKKCRVSITGDGGYKDSKGCFKLEELSHTSGDYNLIFDKMHKTIVQHQNDIPFSEYNILQVFRVHNSIVKERYEQRRKQMTSEITKDGTNCYSYIEEMRLWHGSPYAEKICETGFNLQPSNPNGLFGKGIYFAEHSSKSNQYSWGVGRGCPQHSKTACYDCPRLMLLCKVSLGRKLLTQNAVKAAPSNVDTVVARPEVINMGLRYPEYIIYNQDQAYPSHLIKYKIMPVRCNECDSLGQQIQKTKADADSHVPNICLPDEAKDICTIS